MSLNLHPRCCDWWADWSSTVGPSHFLAQQYGTKLIYIVKKRFYWLSKCPSHRLNMELDLQSLFGLLCTAILIGWEPATPLLPPHLGSYYTRALLVSQDRRRLFVKPPGPSLYVLCMDGQHTYKPCVLYITRVSAVVRNAPIGLDSRTHTGLPYVLLPARKKLPSFRAHYGVNYLTLIVSNVSRLKCGKLDLTSCPICIVPVLYIPFILGTGGQILSPWLEEKVDSGIGLWSTLCVYIWMEFAF